MRRVLPLALLALLVVAPRAEARRGGPGPGQPIWPKKGQVDRLLYERALELQAGMWWHLSPEGVFLESHTRGAGPDELSHQALALSDVAIFTGCYAASQAARWHVTRDPDALRQVRHLARGLANLSAASNLKGRLARNVGRLDRSQPLDGRWNTLEPAPGLPGLWCRTDVSRDQLAGVTLGWALIGRFVDDPEIHALAQAETAAIARRLLADKMWLRDARGAKTKYGELRNDVAWVPFVKNGPLAAIGLAIVVVAADLNPDAADLQHAVGRMDMDGWDGALREQHTFLQDIVNGSNVHMVSLSLLALALSPRARIAASARDGMLAIRNATVGWWNAGICACFLLGGLTRDRVRLLGEIRATLHAMPGKDVPRALLDKHVVDHVVPIWERGPSSWHWTNDVRWRHVWKLGGPESPFLTNTGADWLFAYWLARAAGELKPLVGRGATDTPAPCEMDLTRGMPEGRPRPGRKAPRPYGRPRRQKANRPGGSAKRLRVRRRANAGGDPPAGERGWRSGALAQAVWRPARPTPGAARRSMVRAWTPRPTPPSSPGRSIRRACASP
jgi:hypothetical protein